LFLYPADQRSRRFFGFCPGRFKRSRLCGLAWVVWTAAWSRKGKTGFGKDHAQTKR